jgi:hypothetical protein
MFPDTIPDFFKLINEDRSIYDFVTKPTYTYCLSKENHLQCKRFQLKEEGTQPPPELSPDERYINFADTIVKRKIILKESH